MAVRTGQAGLEVIRVFLGISMTDTQTEYLASYLLGIQEVMLVRGTALLLE